MKKIFKKLAILFLFFNTACATLESVKSGLTGEKKGSGADEFLVKKKDPLVLPPKFNELPIPGQNMETALSEVTDIEQLIQSGSNDNETNSQDAGLGGSIEESVLKKIRQK
tara:strand:- start:21 stop:353 length:333 start_codon:yes stop_codon:yes gene_type:complete